MACRAVIFDWDGTLAHLDGTLDPWDAAGAHLGVAGRALAMAFEQLAPYTPGETVRTPSLETLLPAMALRLGAPAANERQVEGALEAFASALAGSYRLYDDARATLASLRYRGYRLGVLTNSIVPARWMARVIAGTGVAGYFDACVSSADLGWGKPDPRAFEAVVGALATAPGECLMVGDRWETDIAGAVAAGIEAVHLRREGGGSPHGLAIARLTELNTLLGEGMARDRAV